MMLKDIGEMNCFIYLHTAAETTTPDGGVARTWSDYRPGMWASVKDDPGNMFRNQALHAESDVLKTFITRWRPVFDTVPTGRFRIKHNGRIYRPLSIKMDAEKRDYVAILCDGREWNV